MGFGMTAALGVKPQGLTFCSGFDRGRDFMMTMQEMSTAVQYNIP